MLSGMTVLMTGAGAPGAPGIINCYRRNGERDIRVVGVDMRDRVPTAPGLDAFYRVPEASSPDFIGAVIDIARRERVDVIQPLVTRELQAFSVNAAAFGAAGVKVCVAAPEVLEIANDKGNLLDKLKSLGVAVPAYERAATYGQFTRACERLGVSAGPICVKPCRANGSRGFRIIDDNADRYSLLFDQKPSSVYASYDEICGVLSSRGRIPEMLVMEYLPGDEYSVDILADRGEMLCCVPRLRLSMNGGISTSCITKNERSVIEYCASVSGLLKLHGNTGIQVRLDNEKNVKILEINPRVQGSIVNCLAAGVNLPYLGIKQALNEELPRPEVKWDVQMVRCWNEVFFDADGHAFTL